MINDSGAAQLCVDFAEDIGVYRYSAPETCFPKDRSEGVSPDTPARDMYAMGMIVYEVGFRPSWIVWPRISVKSYLVLGLDGEHPVLRVR